MTSAERFSESGRAGARARVDDMRRALAATTDAQGRARLRIRLADLLSALGDLTAAAAELRQAAVESPPSAGLLSAARVIAHLLPAADGRALEAAVRANRPVKQALPRKQRVGPRGSPSSSFPPLDLARLAPAGPPLPAAADFQAVQPVADPIEAAFTALAAKKVVRARRLGEEAARLGPPTSPRMARLADLVKGLDQRGAKRDSLRLARTLTESDGRDPSAAEVSVALAALISRAADVGDSELAARWQSDLGSPPPRVAGDDRPREHENRGDVAQQFRAAQRAALAALTATDFHAVIEMLMPLLGHEVAGGAALALAERIVESLGDAKSEGHERSALLRAAYEGASASRRPALAWRWAEALRAAGDVTGAVAALDRAVAEVSGNSSAHLRRTRADLLRATGRNAALSRALDGDAQAATGQARAALRAEQAALLDGLGEFDSGLEVRLAALKEAPGDMALLVPARQRLEGVGRLERSLELAMAAISHVADRAVRASLLRDVATLSEAGGDAAQAAQAWLEVLELAPGDGAAAAAAERLLRELGDRGRLGALLAWSAVRQGDPEARAAVLWRLAEFRRLDEDAPIAALMLYREIVESRERPADAPPFKDVDWQRRDNELALHTARALAAPTVPTRAQAVADRAAALIDVGRLDEADRDLSRALDLDPVAGDVVHVLERLYERRGDWRGLRHRLAARVEGASGAAAGRLWYGIGRANERMGDPAAARVAYERSVAADEAFRLPLTMLRQLATARADYPEVARVLEKEIQLAGAPLQRVGMMVELGTLLAERLDRPARAVEILDGALAFEPANASALDAMFGAALAAGSWEKAAQALEAMLSAGVAVPDAAQRYHRLGLGAEKGGQVDRALGLYSRSYARNPAFRPTLERLSEICFERQQWDNAWKATEHLIERHSSDLDAAARADLALRSALADLHVAQRLVAASRIAIMMNGPAPQGGARDVADSWASMRFDPRLLSGVEGDRRARVLSRLAEVLALTENHTAHPARTMAREVLAALAVVDRRWADALTLLDAFAGDATLEAPRRCLFLVTAGDILLHQLGDAAGAALRYQRARALNPSEPRLARVGAFSVAG